LWRTSASTADLAGDRLKKACVTLSATPFGEVGSRGVRHFEAPSRQHGENSLEHAALSQPPRAAEAQRARLRELAATHVRYGYRRLTVLLRREGWAVNAKRIYRLYDEEALTLLTCHAVPRMRSGFRPPSQVQLWQFTHDISANNSLFRFPRSSQNKE
jgi:transposase InsO family protein